MAPEVAMVRNRGIYGARVECPRQMADLFSALTLVKSGVLRDVVQGRLEYN